MPLWILVGSPVKKFACSKSKVGIGIQKTIAGIGILASVILSRQKYAVLCLFILVPDTLRYRCFYRVRYQSDRITDSLVFRQYGGSDLKQIF
jgi:hypothetical protein